jgi:hypothetical protein
MIGFDVKTRLLNEDRREPSNGSPDCPLNYQINADAVTSTVSAIWPPPILLPDGHLADHQDSMAALLKEFGICL